MKTVIIKYNAGNIQSVLFALQRIGVEGIVSDNKDEILSADKVIFPGVGQALSAMQYLEEKGLDKVICALKQPTLGICLGMQLMCAHSEEGDTKGLNLFPASVKLFRGAEKVPHVGWNIVNGEKIQGSRIKGIVPEEPEYFYFVHSYYAEPCGYTVATTEYMLPFSAAIQKDNFYAVQFHPEKSGLAGQRVLKNFIEL